MGGLERGNVSPVVALELEVGGNQRRKRRAQRPRRISCQERVERAFLDDNVISSGDVQELWSSNLFSFRRRPGAHDVISDFPNKLRIRPDAGSIRPSADM